VIQQAVIDLANNNPNFFFRDAFFIEQLALAQPVIFSNFFRLKAKQFKLGATLGQGMMLLKHPLESGRLLGADILLAHKDRVQLIPETVIYNLLKAPSVAIQKRGLAILAYCSVDTILKNIPTLIELIITGRSELRAGIQSIINQIAEHAPLQAIVLMRYLLPLLLKQEVRNGTHLFIVELLNGPLKDSLVHLSTETIYTLLESPNTTANTLGASLLAQVDLHQEPLSN